MNKKNVIANRYEVVSHLGQGGMADVFLAVDTILNRQVAIKILRADLSTDAVSILRFEREAQAAAALAHPNIVEIYDVGDYKGHHFIVMEYVPGKTLKQVIRSRGPLVTEEAVDIMKQMCSAIAEAHSRGIIHRDLKPQNVIVKADGSIKILDFGIATAKGSMQLTQANNVMGSVHYLAPELARGEKASPQSDIYALGICFYEMLAGDVPFKADQAVQIALKHMREPMPSIRAVNSSVPQSVENIITRATAKDPAQRYRSCDEMLRDVSTCLRPERLNERKLVLKPVIKNNDNTRTEKQPEEKEERNYKTESHRTNEKQPVKKKHTRNTKVLVIIMILVILIGAGSAVLYNLVRNGTISFGDHTMPNITGMTIEEAADACNEAGITLDQEHITYELTTDTASGIIISSDPESGTSVNKDTTATITVSSGIGVKAEDYTGQKITDVEKNLEDKYPYLKITAKEESSSEAPGTIIRQEQLEPGQLFDPSKAAQITLVYSAYPTVTIPTDIMGMDINSAAAELEGMGLEVRTSARDTTQMSQEEIDELTVGVVVECDPAAGTSFTQTDDNYVTLYYY